MLFTPIYIAMTFIKTWRIRSFRARLLQFLSGNTSVAFCKVPENAAGNNNEYLHKSPFFNIFLHVSVIMITIIIILETCKKVNPLSNVV